MISNEITRKNIETLVMSFYKKVIKDETVGPFFIDKLGMDMSNSYWEPHLKLLVNFWSSIALSDASYHGNPFAPHMHVGELSREVFDQWIKIFFATLDEVYEPQVANLFKERSRIIAGNFMRNLGIV